MIWRDITEVRLGLICFFWCDLVSFDVFFLLFVYLLVVVNGFWCDFGVIYFSMILLRSG